MTDNYEPYKDREEHDFINSLSAELIRIKIAIDKIQAIADVYITNAKNKRRETDERNNITMDQLQ